MAAALALVAWGSRTPAANAAPDDRRLHTLSAADLQKYQRAFALQRDGQIAAAERELAGVKNRLLQGHFLAQRYLAPGAPPPPYADLAAWLQAYRDHPDAHAIHRLAMRQKPRAAKAPPGPTGPELAGFSAEPLVIAEGRERIAAKRRTPAEQRNLDRVDGQFRKQLQDGKFAAAAALLARPETVALLSPGELDERRLRLAHRAFMDGEDAIALAQAGGAAQRSRQVLPRADWTAGLAAWRLGRYDNAAHHFEQLAAARAATPSQRAAGAYWAGRVALKLRQPAEFVRMLELAAQHPRSLYGLLALNQLGRQPPFRWDPPDWRPEDVARLAQIPAVIRAVALSDVGETAAAERELRALRARSSASLTGALLALADRLETPATLLELGTVWRAATGQSVDAALYPLPPWEPANGFQVDPALIFALMRQESAFNPRALSPAGASGLMQLMPRTATVMAGEDRRQVRRRLFAPEFNIELGQRYLQHLLEAAPVNGNLFYLAAAYNAGPGNLQKWLKELRFDDDPLLFAELIPFAETRHFVERVMTNYWIYRARLGQPPISLDQATVGRWPLYDRRDNPNLLAQRAARGAN